MDSTHRHLNRGSSVSVSSDSHNTNNMEHNTLGYQLNEYDLRRIRPLLNEIRNQKIKFRYFLTIDYWYKMDNISKILEDNHHLKKTIRSFYKSDIKMFFFTERHLNPSAKNYGGFHRHILLEDAPESRWKNPTKQLQTWMNELTEKHISQYEEYFSEDAFLPLRMSLLKKVVKGLHHSTPNGFIGLKIVPIYNVSGLLSYCTKQNRSNIPHEYVIDTLNSSGLDDNFIRTFHAHSRLEAVPT